MLVVAGSLSGCELVREVFPLPVEPVKLNKVSEVEANAWATQFENAVKSGDKAQILPLFDLTLGAHHHLAGAKMSRRDMRSLKARVPVGFASTGYGAIFATFAEQKVAPTRLKDVSDTHGMRLRSVVFSVSFGGIDIEQYRLPLSRRSDGKVVAVDVHPLSMGRSITSEVRSMWDSLSKGMSKSELKDIKALRDAQLKRAEGDWKAAATLAASVQKGSLVRRAALLERMMSLSSGDDSDAYARVAQLIVDEFPNDSAAHMALVDMYVATAQWKKALSAINRLEQSAFAPDTHFDVMRSDLHVLLGQYAEAVQALQGVIAKEPSNESAQSSLCMVFFLAEDHGAAAKQLSLLDDKFGLEYDLSLIPESKPFQRSKQGRAFLKARRPR